MSNSRETVLAYWSAAEARDWAAFEALLAEDVCYDLPQTGERVRGRAAVVRFNREYPGDWHLEVERAVGDGRHAATWIRFRVDGEVADSQNFFDLDDAGLITRITDFWPTPYEPPPGREHLVER